MFDLPTHCSNCDTPLTGDARILVASTDPKKRHPCPKCAEEKMPVTPITLAGDPEQIKALSGYAEIGETILEPWEEQFKKFVKPGSENMGSAGWRVAPSTVKLWIKGLLAKTKAHEEEREECLRYCREQNGLPYCKNCALGAKDDEEYDA